MSNDIKEEEEEKFREDREKKFLRQTNTKFDVHLESFRESFSTENSWNALRRRSGTRLRSFYWIFLELKKKQAKSRSLLVHDYRDIFSFIRIAITIAQCRKMYAKSFSFCCICVRRNCFHSPRCLGASFLSCAAKLIEKTYWSSSRKPRSAVPAFWQTSRSFNSFWLNSSQTEEGGKLSCRLSLDDCT